MAKSGTEAEAAAPARVDVVFPTLDEEKALPWLLERIPEGYRAIVVDNGSTDDSAGVARRLGATVVNAPIRGYGSACHAGLLAATAPIVVFCDADASLDPRDIPRLVSAVEDGTRDLVLGRRRPTTLKSWPLSARLANALIAMKLRQLTGYRLTDLGATRAFRREALIELDVRDRASGYPLELVLLASDAGWRVSEVDAPYSPRVGKSKVTGSLRGAFGAASAMWKLLVKFDRELRNSR